MNWLFFVLLFGVDACQKTKRMQPGMFGSATEEAADRSGKTAFHSARAASGWLVRQRTSSSPDMPEPNAHSKGNPSGAVCPSITVPRCFGLLKAADLQGDIGTLKRSHGCGMQNACSGLTHPFCCPMVEPFDFLGGRPASRISCHHTFDVLPNHEALRAPCLREQCPAII